MLEKSGRSEIELLKMDIENGEFTALEPLIKDYFVCQIFIEIHGTPLNHFELLQTMAKYGFRIFNVDPNPYCEACCEYSLINDFCMAQFEVTPLASIIPPVTVWVFVLFLFYFICVLNKVYVNWILGFISTLNQISAY